MSEHTLGKWYVFPPQAPHLPWAVQNVDGENIAEVVGQGGRNGVNARLIARAPTMQAEIDRLRGLLGEWVSEAEQRPYVYRAHRSHQVCICLTCRTRKELEPTDGNT